MRQQKFSPIYLQLVERRYANKLPQEVSVRRFLTPFPRVIHPVLVTRPNRCETDMQLLTELDRLKEYGVQAIQSKCRDYRFNDETTTHIWH
jgi:hypothetical protein